MKSFDAAAAKAMPGVVDVVQFRTPLREGDRLVQADLAATPILAWQWRVDDLLDGADLHSKAGDDSALKVCVFFDLPITRVPFLERQLLRLARTQSDEPLPAATVCYVWDTRLPPDTDLDNAFTRRVRYIVLRSGPVAAHEWMNEAGHFGGAPASGQSAASPIQRRSAAMAWARRALSMSSRSAISAAST